MSLSDFGLPILKKEESIKEMDQYENDTNQKNIFYANLRNKNKVFLVEILNTKIFANKNIIFDLARNKHEGVLQLVSIMTKSNDSSYLCFEFTDILLSSYISCASPDLQIRLILLKQFIELILHFDSMNIKLDNLDTNYIFIEGLENPVIKILNHGIYICNQRWFCRKTSERREPICYRYSVLLAKLYISDYIQV
jgi:hypothetical protein